MNEDKDVGKQGRMRNRDLREQVIMIEMIEKKVYGETRQNMMPIVRRSVSIRRAWRGDRIRSV